MDGIKSRITHGVHENTPLAYHSPGGLMEIVRRKNKKLDAGRFNALTIGRRLGTKLQALDDHKKFIMALAEGKAKRVDAVIRAGLKKGAGVRGLIDLVLKASQGLYKPKGYTEEEILKSLVLLRLGGGRVLTVAHNSLGLPAVSTTRQNTAVTRLLAAASFPSITLIRENIRSVFHSANVPKSLGYVLMVDEIKVEERSRWDPATNKILGLCREHTQHLSLDFCSKDDARAALQAVLDGKCHYAKEVSNSQHWHDPSVHLKQLSHH